MRQHGVVSLDGSGIHMINVISPPLVNRGPLYDTLLVMTTPIISTSLSQVTAVSDWVVSSLTSTALSLFLMSWDSLRY